MFMVQGITPIEFRKAPTTPMYVHFLLGVSDVVANTRPLNLWISRYIYEEWSVT